MSRSPLQAREARESASGNDAVHPIGAASERLGVHPRTLMAYERLGLVRPARRSNRRVYSDDELRWLRCVQTFNRAGGISLAGLSTLLRFTPCWGIREEIERDGERCCPPAYPGTSCLDRVHRAYAGDAPTFCQDCGVYRSNRGRCASALEDTQGKGPSANAPGL